MLNRKSTILSVVALAFVMILTTVGCTGAIKAAMVPEIFSGLGTIADGLAASLDAEGLDSILDGLLDGLERAVYPEASSSS